MRASTSYHAGGGSKLTARSELEQILELEHCRNFLLDDFSPIEQRLKKAKALYEKAMAKLPGIDDGEEELD